MFKCLIHNHEYTDYEFVETKTFLPIDLPIKPMDVKLFLNDVFDYDRVGGSVSHSAFDLMVEFGVESIALVGQDLAFAKDGELYANDARLDLSKKRLVDMGRRFHVKGFYGDEVETNNTFYFFGQSYERFARELQDHNVKLYNCTEGGMFLNGFEHCELSHFIKKYSENHTH